MPDMAAISALASSLKTTVDLTKTMVGLRDAVLVREKAIELSAEIMSAQQSALAAQAAQFELVDRVRDLEKKIVDLENWEAEKQRYELKALASGVLAYVTKSGMENGEPPHSLCANCYNRGRKSLLQQELRATGRRIFMICHTCGAELVIRGERYDDDKPALVMRD
ncbi:hypothetical protein [Methylobacterium sp. JK268]